MKKLTYKGKDYSCRDDETVLKAFMRQGVTVPFSCGNGVCHSCIQKVVDGNIPDRAQSGLRESLRERGYFLTCRCQPETDMVIEEPRAADLFSRAVVYKKEELSAGRFRILLEPASQIYYHAGQFINIRKPSGELRSYSLCSVPHKDYFMELHVKHIEDGTMSSWICDELEENEEVEFQGPLGKSFYSDKSKPILLVGTGCGLSPILGVAKDALYSGHNQPIHLFHGSRNLDGLYLREEVEGLQSEFENFQVTFCISGEDQVEGVQSGRAEQVALQAYDNLSGWSVFLSGQPEMVETARQMVLSRGACEEDIHCDPFWTGSDVEPSQDTSEQSPKKSEVTGQVKRDFPDPDLEVWHALEDGKLLAKALPVFYDRVYADPLLSPFFEGVTKQRLIEKQYNFMHQVLTGEKVFFGERPRNSHHWMVISDELFDYREKIHDEVFREFGVPEDILQKLRATDEIYREDIVKDRPWNKVLFGKEIPVDGYEDMVIDESTLCDSCECEVQAGEIIQYHVRLGKIYCQKCYQGVVADVSSESEKQEHTGRCPVR